MNKNEFKSYAESPVSDPESIVNIMRIIYESDIADSFPKHIWISDNPFFDMYNKCLNRKDYYSETGENRLRYNEIIEDLTSGSAITSVIETSAIYYLSCGAGMYIPYLYNNPAVDNKS